MGSAVLRALTICALLLKTTSSSFVSNDSLTTRQTLRPRIAVCIAVAQVDYHIRAEQSINGKETTEYIHKVSMI